eukprot:CAMPEP_0202703304 /NCGR_PEP_ID=MMETSP1385-20130828/16159_1 /ASSEMBLY_ACC=CAM_ASM_000861 /TAXON_ID=933848 /ORGANISM="Elphidium margaritaceum" /LENGTH=475 /DNA_ID=CAMNT_0049361131 /DNA_START=19 /DNA_END=1446 /DNA_ORIENTATION=-
MGKCLSSPSHGRAVSMSEKMEPELGLVTTRFDTTEYKDGGRAVDAVGRSQSSNTSSTAAAGAAAGKSLSKQQHDIDGYMRREQQRDLREKKLLLLGSGGSGKSTILHQILAIHGNDEHARERDYPDSRPTIRSNVVAGILLLLKKSQELHEADPSRHHDTLIALDRAEHAHLLPHIKHVVRYQSIAFEQDDVLDYADMAVLAQSIALLWQLPQIQATYSSRQYFNVIENLDFFLDRAQQVMSEHYTVSYEHHLRSRRRTTGVVPYEFWIEGVRFKICDAGGQRSERKKWLEHFGGVTAVIFVAALNHFCTVIFEDETKNAMLESLDLFEEICNSRFFRRTELILFLNKNDLFRDRLQDGLRLKILFNEKTFTEHTYFVSKNEAERKEKMEYYEEYNGPVYVANPDDPDEDEACLNEAQNASLTFLQIQYEKRNKVPYKRIFVHVTTATDTDNIKKVFYDVQNIVINSNLRRGGLV